MREGSAGNIRDIEDETIRAFLHPSNYIIRRRTSFYYADVDQKRGVVTLERTDAEGTVRADLDVRREYSFEEFLQLWNQGFFEPGN